MARRAKCRCGCGQAPSTTCRMRKAECRGCGYTVRLSREWIAKGLPVCPCGDRMECRCLEDRVLSGDEAAYSGMLDTACMPGSKGRRTGTHDRRAGQALKMVVGYTEFAAGF
jgi:hypothetical protein